MPGSVWIPLMMLWKFFCEQWMWKTRLWMRSSKRSKVLVPFPQGDYRVVMARHLVGMRATPEACTLALFSRNFSTFF